MMKKPSQLDQIKSVDHILQRVLKPGIFHAQRRADIAKLMIGHNPINAYVAWLEAGAVHPKIRTQPELEKLREYYAASEAFDMLQKLADHGEYITAHDYNNAVSRKQVARAAIAHAEVQGSPGTHITGNLTAIPAQPDTQGIDALPYTDVTLYADTRGGYLWTKEPVDGHEMMMADNFARVRGWGALQKHENGEAEQDGNLHRMAAAWNYCKGLTTEQLQEGRTHETSQLTTREGDLERVAKAIYESRKYTFEPHWDAMVERFIGDDKNSNCWKDVHHDCMREARAAIAVMDQHSEPLTAALDRIKELEGALIVARKAIDLREPENMDALDQRALDAIDKTLRPVKSDSEGE